MDVTSQANRSTKSEAEHRFSRDCWKSLWKPSYRVKQEIVFDTDRRVRLSTQRLTRQPHQSAKTNQMDADRASPRISRILFRSITSLGVFPLRSSHLVKSPSFTTYSAPVSRTRTSTGINPLAFHLPAGISFNAPAMALNRVDAATSAV